MSAKNLSLGLDSSTQSLTAVLVDIDDGSVIYERSLNYAKDDRLNGFGINHTEYICPPREEGEAEQPPQMYLASLDALFADMKADGVDMGAVRVINDSGQQHGHVYLGPKALDLLAKLNADVSGSRDLVDIVGSCFSYGTAPIWKTSNTGNQADDLRRAAGGKDEMIRLTGSDSPLRFTGAVIRRVGQQFPSVYDNTATVQLISSFIPAVLTGNSRVPVDFGNGSGTSLMDYEEKEWSEKLVSAAADGLPGGATALVAKLPELVSPDSVVGSIARYFVDRYGFSDTCRVAAGSGDNPQTKVLVAGDLLSLGTSFVNMVSTDGSAYDLDGYANGMYDGLGRPFMIGCRTNGAMVWDGVRTMHGLGEGDFGPADGSLAETPLGKHLFLWQPDNESFPVSGTIEPTRIDYDEPSLAADYAGAIESALGLVYLYSRGFAAEGGGSDPISVTGGVTKVPEILRRVAAIWNRPVVTIGTVGAALGAAVAGAGSLAKYEGVTFDSDALSTSVLPRGAAVSPTPSDVQAFHADGGYLSNLEEEYERRR
jgi:xylulokinase